MGTREGSGGGTGISARIPNALMPTARFRRDRTARRSRTWRKPTAAGGTDARREWNLARPHAPHDPTAHRPVEYRPRPRDGISMTGPERALCATARQASPGDRPNITTRRMVPILADTVISISTENERKRGRRRRARVPSARAFSPWRALNRRWRLVDDVDTALPAHHGQIAMRSQRAERVANPQWSSPHVAARAAPVS